MTIIDWLTVVAVVACLLISAFYSASETALTASSRAAMMRLEKHGNRDASIVNRLLAKRERLLGAVLFSNNLTNIAASTLATGLLLAAFGHAGVIYATIVMTVIIFVVGEILPKTAAFNMPDRMALWVARPVERTVRWFSPILSAVEWLVRVILHGIGMPVGKIQSILSPREELRGAVDLLHRAGVVEKLDRDMMGGVLDLRELTVSDVMVHRTKIVMLNADDPPREIVDAVLAAAVSRLPLWRDSPDNIVGVLHAKDLLRALHAVGGEAGKIDPAALATPPWFVPDTTPLYEQLQAFRHRKAPFALVVDEYGELEGLVTIKDIVEEIVGDITTEHEIAVPGVRVLPDGPSMPTARSRYAIQPRYDWNILTTRRRHRGRGDPRGTIHSGAGPELHLHGFRFQVLRWTATASLRCASRRSRARWRRGEEAGGVNTIAGKRNRRSYLTVKAVARWSGRRQAAKEQQPSAD
jgi:Mg2+/Co2+ transporter CorB